MTFEIRDVALDELEAILALNNAAVPHVNSLPLAELDRFANVAAYFRVAVTDEAVLAVLIAFLPGADYASENYLWFQSRYDDFVYIDRIIVAPEASGNGIAKALYGDLATAMVNGPGANKVKAMTCEVNVRPPNLVSTEMHRRLGFVEVGQQETGGGEKRVSLMRRTL
jgi:uncharacterized protein